MRKKRSLPNVAANGSNRTQPRWYGSSKVGCLPDAPWSALDAVSCVADCNPKIPNRRADATQHRFFFKSLPIG